MRRFRLLRDERGAVLVEFALVVPFFVMMFFAVVEFAFALFTMHAMTAAVREGGRYAAILPDLVANDERVRNITVSAFNEMLIFGDELAADDVTVSAAPTAAPWTVSVTVADGAYTYEALTPIAVMIGLDDFSIVRSAVFRWERGGS